jgi:hypothetical protein
MLNFLRDELNKTHTLNGADAFKSTKSAVLDLFSRGANLRTEMTELEHLIREAFNENDELALRAVFYLSDIRGGQGTRDVMKAAIKVIVERHPNIVEKLMPLFVEFTRWDMLYEFVGTKFEKTAFQTMLKAVVSAQKTNDYLVFKWLKSADATSKETRHLGWLTAKYFGMDLKTYRKFLTAGRAKLNLVENALTHKRVDSINYAQVPSKANLKYRTAFYRHDEFRYRGFLESVMTGEKKMNMSVGYPHEIVAAYRTTGGMGWGSEINSSDLALEASWKSLPNFLGDSQENLLVVADVSGSMSSSPKGATNITAMDISVALAIYTAQRNHGHFHNNYITFSAQPALLRISDKDSLRDAINKVIRSPWGMNTDIDKVFELLLRVAKNNKLSQDDMPSTIVIVSDMQFDACARGGRNFKSWESQFQMEGFELPKIVFWNVMDYGNVPVSQKENGVALIGGYSPSILEFIYNGNIVTPYDFMLKVIMTPRYDLVIDTIS